jgi:hypothetical protein
MFPLPECRECFYCLYPKGNFCEKEKLVSMSLTSHLIPFPHTGFGTTLIMSGVFFVLFCSFPVVVAQYSLSNWINVGWNQQIYLQREENL